ncbi:MAG: SAM-dependent methyltransferase [Myxococcota bacterium]
MRTQRASRTAEVVAAFRAIHTKYHDAPKLVEDPYAAQLTSAPFRLLVRSPALYWLATFRRFYGWSWPLQGEALARGRYAEDKLEASLDDGIAQYVMLGAGLDSFALRRRDLTEKIAVFEIDHPATQRAKLERLRKNGWEVPRSVTMVAVDMEVDSLRDRLLQTSYAPTTPTFFALLGTVPYLTREAFASTLADVSSLCPAGSLFVFDFPAPEFFDAIPSSYHLRKMDRGTKRRGEPLITSFCTDELRELLADAGWELAELVSPEEQEARYFAEREDLLCPLDHFYFACARKVGG